MACQLDGVAMSSRALQERAAHANPASSSEIFPLRIASSRRISSKGLGNGDAYGVHACSGFIKSASSLSSRHRWRSGAVLAGAVLHKTFVLNAHTRAESTYVQHVQDHQVVLESNEHIFHRSMLET
jgi:hypothetical protein